MQAVFAFLVAETFLSDLLKFQDQGIVSDFTTITVVMWNFKIQILNKRKKVK